MVECPYCGDDKKPRGLKNHVRMAGGEHGEAGTVPDDFDDRLQTDDGESDSPSEDESDDMSGSDGVTTLSPDELSEVHSDESDADTDESGGEGNDDLPFDPDDPDAIRLDGGETMDIRKDGEVYPGVEAEEGDYLLKTDQGPVLYDHETGDMYEVLTV